MSSISNLQGTKLAVTFHYQDFMSSCRKNRNQNQKWTTQEQIQNLSHSKSRYNRYKRHCENWKIGPEETRKVVQTWKSSQDYMKCHNNTKVNIKHKTWRTSTGKSGTWCWVVPSSQLVGGTLLSKIINRIRLGLQSYAYVSMITVSIPMIFWAKFVVSFYVLLRLQLFLSLEYNTTNT